MNILFLLPTAALLEQDRVDCLKDGNKWIYGFDISGHIFLMTYSNLIRIEEFAFLIKKFEQFAEFRYWRRLSPDRTINIVSPFRFQFNTFYTLTFILTFIMFSITLIWDYMMLQTTLFYHSFLQKVSGLSWAILFWLLTYRLLFLNRFFTTLSVN